MFDESEFIREAINQATNLHQIHWPLAN